MERGLYDYWVHVKVWLVIIIVKHYSANCAKLLYARWKKRIVAVATETFMCTHTSLCSARLWYILYLVIIHQWMSCGGHRFAAVLSLNFRSPFCTCGRIREYSIAFSRSRFCCQDISNCMQTSWHLGVILREFTFKYERRNAVQLQHVLGYKFITVDDIDWCMLA